MKTALFGCKATTRFMLNGIHDVVGIDNLITIAPDLGERHDVADYDDLRDLAASKGIAVYQAEKYTLKHENDIAAIAAMQLDIAFVIGWQRLIPGDVLSGISIGAFGMHGSTMDLPLGRGRSPMNWSLIEGRRLFHTNLFRYDAGVDSGDILDSFVFSVTDADTAESLHFKNALAMKHLIVKNIGALKAGTFNLRKQKADLSPTYYPKRTPSDSLIDWTSDVFAIERFVRAVTRPFNGAYTFCGDHKLSVYRAQIFETDLVDYGYADALPGCVLEVFPSGKFLVKAQGGMLLVTDHETTADLKPGCVLDNGPEKPRDFPRNRLGFHDMAPS